MANNRHIRAMSIRQGQWGNLFIRRVKEHQNYDIILEQDQQTIKYPNRVTNIFNKVFINITGELKIKKNEICF